MANHAYVKTDQFLNPKEVDAHVRRIVKEKLGDAFIVNFDEEDMSWFIDYPKHDYIGFVFWLADDIEYGSGEGDDYEPYDEPLRMSRQSVIEFRHGHTFNFMWWVEGVIRENLGAIYNARMFDDGCEIDPEPHPEKYETFNTFVGNDPFRRKHYMFMTDEAPKELLKKLGI